MFNNKQNEDVETTIAKAVEALKALTYHFQESNDLVTIKLTVPWKKYRNMCARGAGEDKQGLLGIIDLSSPFKMDFMDHPFIKALQTTKLCYFSRDRSSFGTTFRCCMVLHTHALIEQLPEKCQAIIDEDLNQKQRLSYAKL